MLPTLISVGPLKIYSMGFFLLLGVIMGLFVAWKKARENHVDDREFMEVFFTVLFWALVVSRGVYIVTNFDQFGWSLLRWVWLTFYVGLSFWGALLGGVGALIFMVNKMEKDVFGWLDFMSLGISATISWAMVGVFLNGSFMGVPLEIPGGVFPTQLLGVVWFFALFWLLWSWESKYRMFEWYKGNKSSAESGFLWFVFLIALGLFFVVMSFFRVDLSEVFGVGQGLIWGVLSLLIGVGGLWLRAGGRKRNVSRRTRLGRSPGRLRWER